MWSCCGSYVDSWLSAYLGSRSYDLERMFDRNEVIPRPGNTQTRRPYSEFTRLQTIGNVAEANYNSLAVKLTRRLDNGFSALVGYTLSKSRDNGSGIRGARRPER